MLIGPFAHARYKAPIRPEARREKGLCPQVSEVENGMELLNKVQSNLASLMDKLKRIEGLCEESTRLVEHQDRIQILSSTSTNLTAVIRDTEAIIALPREAATAEQLLQTDANLEEVFEYITVLVRRRPRGPDPLPSGPPSGTPFPVPRQDATCNQHKSYLRTKGSQRLPERHLATLQEYFTRVEASRAAAIPGPCPWPRSTPPPPPALLLLQGVVRKFEERLFLHFKDVVGLAEKRPAKLVQAVRLVELQERIDRVNVGMTLRDQGGAGPGPGSERSSSRTGSHPAAAAAAAAASPGFQLEMTPAMLSSLPEGLVKSYG